jgi:tRNA nucleotidyltransferase (CCA-adding enzyme)
LDIATSATPADVQQLFGHTVPTGIAYGTVTVFFDDVSFQITTFRSDGTYSDGRHPDDITYTRSFQADLLRRDFTMNALACGTDGIVVDLVGGLDDIQNRLVRCVGEAKKRFEEDQLRKLRAIRFMATLNFQLEEYTQNAILENPSLSSLSKERIQSELNKILVSDGAGRAFYFMHNSAVLSAISPIFSIFSTESYPHSSAKDTLQYLVDVMNICPKMLPLRLAGLLIQPCQKTQNSAEGDALFSRVEYFLYEHKYPNDVIKRVMLLLRTCTDTTRRDDASLKAMMDRYSADEIEAIFTFQHCHARASLAKPISTLNDIDANIKAVARIIATGEPYKRRHLAISSQTLLDTGLVPHQLGSVYEMLLSHVWRHPEENNEEKLLTYLKQNMSRVKGGKK